MNGARSLATAASTAGRGPFSAARATMHTPLRLVAWESFVDSELVTFTVCALAQTASATMNTTTSGLCQLEPAVTAAATIRTNRRKNSAVHQTDGGIGGESRPGSTGAGEIVDGSRIEASAATSGLGEGNRSNEFSALIRRPAHPSMRPPQ